MMHAKPWRKVVQLQSKLGHRKTLSNAAMKKIKPIYIKNNQVKCERDIKY